MKEKNPLRKYDYIPKKNQFNCISYKSKLECQTCDSFGRNSDKNVDTAQCYLSKKLKDSLNEREIKINKECSRHPENFRGLSPEEFAKEFVHTNYFYQRECFKEIIKEYDKEKTGDKRLGKKQLSSGLEELSKTFKGPVSDAIDKVCKACKKYLKNPFSH